MAAYPTSVALAGGNHGTKIRRAERRAFAHCFLHGHEVLDGEFEIGIDPVAKRIFALHEDNAFLLQQAALQLVDVLTEGFSIPLA